MSIVNVHVGRDEAVVVMDTRARLTNGESIETTKIIPLAHIDAVMAGRGLLTFAAMCWLMLLESDIADFDVLESRMPDVLQRAFHELIRRRATTSQDLQELTLVGWSPREQSMRGVSWLCQDRDVGFKAQVIKPWRVAPDLGVLFDGSWPGEDVVETLCRAARVQTFGVRQTVPDATIGGRVVVTTVRRGSITMEMGESLDEQVERR